MRRNLAILWTCIVPLGWIAVAVTGVWAFVSLGTLGEFRTDGTPRTVLDKAFPYLFLLMVPIGVYFAWSEFCEARDNIPLADAADEKARQMRKRQEIAQSRLTDRFPLDEAQRASLVAALDTLRDGGVLMAGEVDNDRAINLAETMGLEDADLYETAHLLGDYAQTYGPFANCLMIPDQVEVFDADIILMVEGFARLAGRADALGSVNVRVVDSRSRPPIGDVTFTLDGTEHVLTFDYPGKNASGALMDGLARVFEVGVARFVSGYFDSVYLISRLDDDRRRTMNAAIDPDYETFQRL